MSRHIRAIVIIAGMLALSFALGSATAPSARAVPNELTLYIHAGTSAGTANMVCGWHQACTPANTGNDSLDWQQSSGTAVHFHSNSYYFGVGASMTGVASRSDTAFCTRIKVLVKRPNGSDLGDVYYVHTKNPVMGTFTIGSTAYPNLWWTARQVGTTMTVAEELSTCTLTGPHLHQGAGSPFARHTGAIFPDYASTIDDVDITSTSYYQNYVTGVQY